MAQHVSYWDNYVNFKEGPFVITNPMDNGYRIEAENKGNKPKGCPTLPHITVYRALEKNGFKPYKTMDKESVEAKVDWLNQQAKEGKCVIHAKGFWHFPEFKD